MAKLMCRSILRSAGPSSRHSQAGMTLVELMVGLAVGMMVSLVVSATLVTMDLQKRTTVSGNDAKESGQFGISLLEREARLAGAGLFYNGQLICTKLNAYQSWATVFDVGPLAPVKIQDGGAAGSDQITFTYGSATGGSSISHIVDEMSNASSDFIVANEGRLENNDFALIGVPGSNHPCALFEIAAFTPGATACNGITVTCTTVHRAANVRSPYDQPAPGEAITNAPTYGYQDNAPPSLGPAVISRLGDFTNATYAIMCNSLVMHAERTRNANCTASPLTFQGATPLVGNIVMLQAQYGVTAQANSDVVTDWVDAIGPEWTAPDDAHIRRIKAIRIVIVSRSKEPAATAVTNACTNPAGVQNIGPCSFLDRTAPVIDLSRIPVPAGRTWQHYRYRTYYSVVPLRNVLWDF